MWSVRRYSTSSPASATWSVRRYSTTAPGPHLGEADAAVELYFATGLVETTTALPVLMRRAGKYSTCMPMERRRSGGAVPSAPSKRKPGNRQAKRAAFEKSARVINNLLRVRTAGVAQAPWILARRSGIKHSRRPQTTDSASGSPRRSPGWTGWHQAKESRETGRRKERLSKSLRESSITFSGSELQA